jgi:predicted translin family RNA/ssDNA-binding protein
MNEKTLMLARELVRKCTIMQMKIDVARRRLKALREARATATKERRGMRAVDLADQRE